MRRGSAIGGRVQVWAEDKRCFSILLTTCLISVVACLDASSSSNPMTTEKRVSINSLVFTQHAYHQAP